MPDVRAQDARFGRTVLRGPRLAEYVAWRTGLSEERRQEWDGFLDGLRPEEGKPIDEAIRRYRPSGPEDWATRGKEILLDAMTNS